MKQHLKYFVLIIILILIYSQTFSKNRGITNCGNSCYFNSCIQCLSYMNDLNGIFNLEDYPSGSIARLYIKMLPLLKQKKGPLKINSPIEYPETVASFYLTTAQKFFGVQYNNEDASEFLTNFFSCFENKQDYIDSLIGFTMIAKTRCKICQNISTVYSSERVLNVDIPKRGSSTIMNCLNTISDPQFFNDYQCDVCNKHVDAIAHTYFFNLPKYLIISLKRFRNVDKKIQKAVKFGLNLNIPSYANFLDKNLNLKKDINYELFAFIVHSGELDGGHYWAYAKDEKNLWYKYDDEKASFAGKTKISDYLKNVIDTGIDGRGTPYILFYKINDSSVPVLEKWQSSSQKYLFQQKIAKLKTSLQELKTKLESLHKKLTLLKNKLG